MYIFSRTATIKPEHLDEGIAFAVEIAAHVTTVTGKAVNVFNLTFGAPMGTVMWSSRHESQAEAADISAKLLVDPGYMASVKAHVHLLVSSPTDALVNVVSSTLEAQPRSIYEITRSTIANGKFAKAMAFGVKAQEFVAKATGLPTAFTSSVYGAYGEVGWLVGGSSMADIDLLREVESGDPAFLALLEEAGDLFVEGSGTNSLIEKLN